MHYNYKLIKTIKPTAHKNGKIIDDFKSFERSSNVTFSNVVFVILFIPPSLFSHNLIKTYQMKYFLLKYTSESALPSKYKGKI